MSTAAIGRPRKVNQKLNNMKSENIEIRQSVKEAYDSELCDHWKDAMAIEYNALIRNDTWSVVDLP